MWIWPAHPDPDFDSNADIVMDYYYSFNLALDFRRREANLRRAVDNLLDKIWRDPPQNTVAYW